MEGRVAALLRVLCPLLRGSAEGAPGGEVKFYHCLITSPSFIPSLGSLCLSALSLNSCELCYGISMARVAQDVGQLKSLRSLYLCLLNEELPLNKLYELKQLRSLVISYARLCNMEAFLSQVPLHDLTIANYRLDDLPRGMRLDSQSLRTLRLRQLPVSFCHTLSTALLPALVSLEFQILLLDGDGGALGDADHLRSMFTRLAALPLQPKERPDAFMLWNFGNWQVSQVLYFLRVLSTTPLRDAFSSVKALQFALIEEPDVKEAVSSVFCGLEKLSRY